jgi:multidrug efflux pump subunit AcrA (membrane-fusion protein)
MLDKADTPLDVPLEPPRDRRPSARRGFLWPVVQFALMALVLGGAWLAMQSLAASKRERTPRPFTPLVYTVETAIAERADNRPQIRLYGQVETGRNVDLRTTVSGDVVEIHPDLVAGRRVAEGTVLSAHRPFCL